MAKGNMLQGMARGKVGDVVFSRLNGEQISRVRNRHPKNPRSNAQLYQRAIMATVMQAYSAGKVIFDHAFQGREVGAGNQRRFMALNAKQLRSQVANDINNNVAVASQVGRVVAPGTQMPVPALLIVSEGTYKQAVFNFTPASSNSRAHWNLPTKESNETLAQYAEKNGLVPGDIYTVCGFTVKKGTDFYQTPGITSAFGKVRESQFGYVRLTVKDTVLSSTSTSFTFGDIFDIESSNNIATFRYDTYNMSIGIASIKPSNVTNDGDFTGVVALIRSRKDNDLRSTSELVIGDVIETPESDGRTYGIASEYVIDAWAAGTSQLGDSDLILEGGNFDGRAAEQDGD